MRFFAFFSLFFRFFCKKIPFFCLCGYAPGVPLLGTPGGPLGGPPPGTFSCTGPVHDPGVVLWFLVVFFAKKRTGALDYYHCVFLFFGFVCFFWVPGNPGCPKHAPHVPKGVPQGSPGEAKNRKKAKAKTTVFALFFSCFFSVFFRKKRVFFVKNKDPEIPCGISRFSKRVFSRFLMKNHCFSCV